MEGHTVTTMNDNTRCDYSDIYIIDCYEVLSGTVTEVKGDSRYEGPPDVVIPLFCRDLLLVAISQGDQALLGKFKTHRAAAKPTLGCSYPMSLTHAHLCSTDIRQVTLPPTCTVTDVQSSTAQRIHACLRYRKYANVCLTYISSELLWCGSTVL